MEEFRSLLFRVWNNRWWVRDHLTKRFKQRDVLQLAAANTCQYYRCPKSCCCWFAKDDFKAHHLWYRLTSVYPKWNPNGCRRSTYPGPLFLTNSLRSNHDNSWWGISRLWEALGTGYFPFQIDEWIYWFQSICRPFASQSGNYGRLKPTGKIGRILDALELFHFMKLEWWLEKRTFASLVPLRPL